MSSHHGMAANIDTKREHQHTQGHTRKRVKEATKLSAETRIPQTGSQDHREQPFRRNIHPGTSKQTPTMPGRNESGEKRINGETGGET